MANNSLKLHTIPLGRWWLLGIHFNREFRKCSGQRALLFMRLMGINEQGEGALCLSSLLIDVY